MSQYCATAAMNSDGSLGCIKMSPSSQDKWSFFSTLVRLHLEMCVHCWAPQYEKHLDILETVQHWATEMLKQLEHFCEDSLIEVGFLFMEKRRLRVIWSVSINIWREDTKRTGLSSSEWYPVPEQEAMSTNGDTKGSVSHEWLSTDTSCHEDRLWQ